MLPCCRGTPTVETPLTPLDFLRRARSLYGERLASVDGGRRLTYHQFGERCDQPAVSSFRLGVSRSPPRSTLTWCIPLTEFIK